MKYKIERIVDGKWFPWGTYDSPVLTARAAFELGRMGIEKIRITPVHEVAE